MLLRFINKGKFSPRNIGTYKYPKRLSKVSYALELPQELEAVHTLFNFSMLKKDMGNPSLIIPNENIEIKYILYYEEIPVHILDR